MIFGYKHYISKGIYHIYYKGNVLNPKYSATELFFKQDFSEKGEIKSNACNFASCPYRNLGNAADSAPIDKTML